MPAALRDFWRDRVDTQIQRQKGYCKMVIYSELELGPRFLPKPTTTLTNRLLYCARRLARPVSFFFLSSAFSACCASATRSRVNNSAYLGGLALDLTGTCKGSVDLATEKTSVHGDSVQAADAMAGKVARLKDAALADKVESILVDTFKAK